MVRERYLLRENLSRNATYHGGFRNNETYYNMALFADTMQKVGAPKINKENPDISVHYVTFSI